MADKIATGAWLVWRNTSGGVEFFGLLDSQEHAEIEISVINAFPEMAEGAAVDAVANGDDGIQIVEACEIAFAVIGSHSEFPND